MIQFKDSLMTLIKHRVLVSNGEGIENLSLQINYKS